MKMKKESLANLQYWKSTSSFSEEHVKKAIDYITGGHNKQGQKYPTGAGLAKCLGVSRKTLYVWANQFEDFGFVIEAMNQEQEIKLINGGLYNEYNPTITKLLLAKHGYHDKHETDITTNGESINRIELVALTGNNENSED